MRQVFADTSYYGALLNPMDEFHGRALTWSQEHADPVVLTDFIVLELGNALCRAGSRGRLVEFIRFLRTDPGTTVVPLSRELLDAGWELYSARLDKDWSLTDCISFEVMHKHGLTEALTADRHFEQAGFKVLLR
jgi:predicted nucleic acid-binding protein